MLKIPKWEGCCLESCLSLLKWELFFNNAKRKQCFPLNQRKKEVPWFPEVLLSLSLWAVNFIQSKNNLFRLDLGFPSPPALLSCTLVVGMGTFWVPGSEGTQITVCRSICCWPWTLLDNSRNIYPVS
uniref:Uncharacterized protein n=1 Tax=Cyanoderma ruficeps TaxID=181631 RepID=A0A8C3NQE5_9PASS